MRILPVSAAALCAAIGLAAGPGPARADSPVVIEGADEDTRKAILDLLPDRDRPATLFEAERIAEEAAARATAWLRSEGYYASEVTPETTEDPVSARLVIAPGPRFLFDPPQVIYTGAAPDGDAQHAVTRALETVRAGAPARSADVLSTEAAVLTALREQGFADVAAGDRRVVVDHATGRVSAEFHIDAGAYATLGEVRAAPDTLFRPSFVRSLQNWETGAQYTPERLSQLRRDITSTGAVSVATTRLAAPNEAGVRDVILEVEPARRNAYELGLGYSTTEGVGIEGEWTRRNLTRRADSLVLALSYGELLQSASLQLNRPHAAGLNHTRSYGVSVTHEDTTAYERQGVALFTSVDAAPRLHQARSYGLRLSADEYDNVGSGVSSAYVLSGFADWRHDTTELTLDPREGSITEFRLEPSVSTGDATLGFVRAMAEGRLYESFGDNDRLTLAARLRVGWLEAVAGDVNDVPPDRRFYAGGGGSVRGYAYNSIYPPERDALGLAPGGQGLLETSLEARWRFNERIGAAAFIDGGTAFDDWGEAADLSWGVGVGARYNLGFAPLRVDLAVPLDDSQSDEDFAVYISIGQAF
ncbi:autotransporter assembly complex family protein [Terricaulis sp.]|uniref:autotransporter assembly complex family protein n=1 Tax=Terricaulis sp. TaxID=2768686 RepID=UPI003784ADBE